MRQQHATPQHINLTTRRIFVGPIPEGWLKSHRKSWYKQSFNISHYSSRAATFSASFSGSNRTQGNGRDGPSATAFNASFPQPDDAGEEEEYEDDLEGIGDRLSIPVSRQNTDGGSISLSKRTSDNIESSGSRKSTRSQSVPSFSTAVSRLNSGSQKKEASGLAPLDVRGASSSTALGNIQRPQKPSKEEPTEGPSKLDTIGISTGAQNEAVQLSSSITTQRISVGEASTLPGEALSSTASLIPRIRGGAGGTTATAGGYSSLLLPPVPASTGLVRFNIPDDVINEEAQLRSDLARSRRRRSWRRHGQSRPGTIVKMEKMLVRVDSTMQKLPPEYNENDSLKTEARTVDNWSELVVVCRESTDEVSDFCIQMYKSRVIPAMEQPQLKRAAHEIPLIRKTTQVNLFSSLDKTLVIWVPWKLGTRVYILRTRSAANAVEWYTFLRSTLGWKRSPELQVHVPDFNVTLKLEDPFGELLQASREAARSAETDHQAILKGLEAERAVAGTIIKRCMRLLEDSPEWADVLEAWLKDEKIGLAWKRYDRLEWVHGANEQRMHGTIAMQKSHDLELRPKQHYPTAIKSEDGTSKEEPFPLEGFLVRLTSQKGRLTRLGKMFYKRLYFSTHNQYLCYCRPAKALPPPPPTLTLGANSKIPSAQHIVNHTPLVYNVNPYSTTEGAIDWLKHGTAATKKKHDEAAYKEAERKVNTLLNAEGYINLSHVVRVQNIQRGSSPADASMNEGPDVDFHADVPDTARDDGKTSNFDDDRTFELVLRNGLMIRLQAYNERTKKEWMTGLEKLVLYWKVRLADDMNTFKMIRQLNLETLDIDEETESMLGQFAEKWEVTRAVASPQLFNMCGISCCRAITVRKTFSEQISSRFVSS